MPTIPMRESELQRPRKRKNAKAPEVTKGEMMPVEALEPNPDWHPIALNLYTSLATSGQSHWYQNSDWAIAFSICDDISRYKVQEDRADRMNARREAWEAMTEQERLEADMDPKVAPPWGGKGGSAIKLQTAMSALSGLMVTEGDRRRLHMELQEPSTGTEEDATVLAMDAYRQALGL